MVQEATVTLPEVLDLSEDSKGGIGVQVPTRQEAHLPLGHTAANRQLMRHYLMAIVFWLLYL